jgi:hypothetical protein
MSRSSSAVEGSSARVSGAGAPLGVVIPAVRAEGTRLQVVERSDHLPEDETPPPGALRLVLVTESGFEVPLVASPAQATRLLRISSNRSARGQHLGRARDLPQSRATQRPRPVPVAQLLSRGRLVSWSESPFGGGAA